MDLFIYTISGNVGAGEREGRVASSMVARRHFRLVETCKSRARSSWYVWPDLPCKERISIGTKVLFPFPATFIRLCVRIH